VAELVDKNEDAKYNNCREKGHAVSDNAFVPI
ncbi:uncharacterized protein METZ01_LOCUS6522, partial [marine metagenome]